MEGLIHNMQPGTLPVFILKEKHYIILSDSEDAEWIKWRWVGGKASTYADDKVIGPVALGVWDDLS